MNDLDFENKRWLARHLDSLEHGERSRVAREVGIDSTKLSRMANVDPKANPKNTQKISVAALTKMAAIFKDLPPSMVGAREVPPPQLSQARELKRIPIIDRVSAGKLKMPLSQIPERDLKWISLSGLGTGDFIGFQLEQDADSIDRAAPPGSVLIVDKSDDEPKPGRIYVFSLGGELTTKQWQAGPPPYLAPYSWNPVHKPTFIKRKRDLEVIGRVRRAVIDL